MLEPRGRAVKSLCKIPRDQAGVWMFHVPMTSEDDRKGDWSHKCDL